MMPAGGGGVVVDPPVGGGIRLHKMHPRGWRLACTWVMRRKERAFRRVRRPACLAARLPPPCSSPQAPPPPHTHTYTHRLPRPRPFHPSHHTCMHHQRVLARPALHSCCIAVAGRGGGTCISSQPLQRRGRPGSLPLPAHMPRTTPRHRPAGPPAPRASSCATPPRRGAAARSAPPGRPTRRPAAACPGPGGRNSRNSERFSGFRNPQMAAAPAAQRRAS